jgi:hypothetical protein
VIVDGQVLGSSQALLSLLTWGNFSVILQDSSDNELYKHIFNAQCLTGWVNNETILQSYHTSLS